MTCVWYHFKPYDILFPKIHEPPKVKSLLWDGHIYLSGWEWTIHLIIWIIYVLFSPNSCIICIWQELKVVGGGGGLGWVSKRRGERNQDTNGERFPPVWGENNRTSFLHDAGDAVPKEAASLGVHPGCRLILPATKTTTLSRFIVKISKVIIWVQQGFAASSFWRTI